MHNTDIKKKKKEKEKSPLCLNLETKNKRKYDLLMQYMPGISTHL